MITYPIYSKQKQSPGGALRNFAKLTGKHLCQNLFLRSWSTFAHVT